MWYMRGINMEPQFIEWADLYEEYDNEDDPQDPERLTIIDDIYTMTGATWNDDGGASQAEY
jgi:hypothetical protein